ncbi:probable multidrug resistance-associated protein lethal(2)03659 [Anoplophora glabripennis]|nr:probable multidrug resistance-associated protein lethal(2)03659 [Anoplophora glabripennis]
MEDTRKRKNERHPRENANIFSSLFFCWTIPTFLKGYKRDLDEDDLYGSLKDHDSHRLGIKLEDAWVQENKIDKPSLTRAIWRVFGKEICCYGIVLFTIEFGTKLAQPLLLAKLMQYYVPNQTVSKNDAIMYGSLIILASFINALLGHNYAMGIQHLGMKIRVACTSLIYKKSLRISKSATVAFNTGKIINMLANDLGRFDNIFLSFHNIWAAPLQIFLVTFLSYYLMGVYALAGIIFFVLFIPVQILLGKKTSKYRLKTAVRTDERVRLMNEIVSGIQVIKMYTWEKPFEQLAQYTRRLEIKQIRAASMVRAINASVSMFLNRIALYFAVLAYTLGGNVLQAYYVFVVTSFYNVLKQPLVFHIPQAISSLAEASVSVKRITDFLLVEETEVVPKTVNHDVKTVGIFFHIVSVRWNLTGEEVLSDVNFSAKKNELIAIVGPVGSGKSTLFQVILKELPITKGTLHVSGIISYASQEPWLFSGTIKENILFGEEMNLTRYKEVCRVCALEKDFSFLQNGDETIVGDKGITLSGGQKARINLARAVYKNAEIYLLDDPLSAVDMHVGKQLYDNCILDFLRGKCVLLITHQLQYLRNVNRIYVIKNGVLDTCESFDQFDSVHNEESDNYKNDTKGLEEPLLSRNNTETKEHKQSGTIQSNVYRKYIKFGGGYSTGILIISLFIIAQFLASTVDYFLTYWVNLEESKVNRTTEEIGFLNDLFMYRDNCLYLYSSLICSIILATIIRSTSFMQVCMNASKRLYYNMSASILNTNIKFFYTNPAGRILNRFSKDVGLIDEFLPLVVLETLQVLFNVISITALVSIVNPWILIPTGVVLIIFYWLKSFFLASSQNLKRMEATARSPVFSHISDSMRGVATIRALNAEDYLVREFEFKQNSHSSAFYLFMACNRTFGFWLDFNCVVYTGIVIMSLLLMLDKTTGGNVGLAITQSLSLVGMLQFGIRQWSEMENQMTAVERAVEYAEFKPEADTNNGERSEFKDWLKLGCIQFKNVSLKYNLQELSVLNNINVTIKAKEKVGIVGRTGAGKSSLVVALLRLVNTEGSVTIDNIDTKTIPLKLLRSKISIIPQDPVLFQATLRWNLDPFDEYKDDQLWAALKEVQLDRLVEEQPGGLYSKVYENGSNFSVGQKQLLCIARALVRKNKILILDEATSSVDPETDTLIQNSIRDKFSDCTVLTIAHRLRTIMDSDKIMVLETGSVVEFDHPYNLLQNKESTFYELLTTTEDSDFLDLTRIAEQNFKKNNGS